MAIVIVDAQDKDADGFEITVDLFSDQPDIPAQWKYLTKEYPPYVAGSNPDNPTETRAQYIARLRTLLRNAAISVKRHRIARYRAGSQLSAWIGVELS